MISRTFFKSSLIYTLIGSLPYVSGFILLFWFTAWLTPAQFGVNALYLSLMYFVQIVSTAGWDLSVGVLHFDYRDDRTKLKEFLGTVFTGLIILGCASFILFSAGGFNLFRFTFSSGDLLELIPFGIFTILSGILTGIFKTYSGLLVAMQRPVPFFWLNLTSFLITITASLTLLYLFPFTLYGPVLGRLIPAVLTAGVSLLLLARQYGLNWRYEYLKKILSYSAPLLVYAVLTWVITYIDRFIILKFLADPVMVGIYDFAVKLVLGIELIIAGLSNTITPKVFSAWKDQKVNESTQEINRYYNALTAVVLLLIPLFIILAPLIIPLLIKKPVYYQAFEFLPLLAAGYAARVWFYMLLAPVLFFKRTRALPGIFLISGIVQVVAGILLIRWLGVWGAVWTNLLVKLVQASLLLPESRKIFHFKVNKWKIVWLPVLIILFIVATEPFAGHGNRIWFGGLQLILTGILVYFTYRKELMELPGKIFPRLFRSIK
jgi:O-antigen/teichoic acid export membrane protein